jgi:hypothetical protein
MADNNGGGRLFSLPGFTFIQKRYPIANAGTVAILLLNCSPATADGGVAICLSLQRFRCWT